MEGKIVKVEYNWGIRTKEEKRLLTIAPIQDSKKLRYFGDLHWGGFEESEARVFIDENKGFWIWTYIFFPLIGVENNEIEIIKSKYPGGKTSEYYLFRKATKIEEKAIKNREYEVSEDEFEYGLLFFRKR